MVTFGQKARRAGITLVEVMVVFAVLGLVLTTILGAVSREAELLSNATSKTAIGAQAHILVDRIDEDLRQARGCLPLTTLETDVEAGDERLSLVVSRGFPYQGDVVVDPYDEDAERAGYDAFDGATGTLGHVERGALGSVAKSHAAGTIVLGAGVALVTHDGLGTRRALGPDGELEFVGDGTGFSYRVPVDPDRTGSRVTSTGVRWGGSVQGEDRTSGRLALRFRAVRTLSEADVDSDINGDGDIDDAFDIGRIVRCCWDAEAADPRGVELVLSPAFVVQPQGDPGGDVDGDGFADPIFLWDSTADLLSLRLFVLQRGADRHERAVALERLIHLENRAELPPP